MKQSYKDDTVNIAKNLLGKKLVRVYKKQRISGIIVETEAYLGKDDPCCHSRNGLKTKRNLSMYLDGGHSYVYFIYGMYFCMNIVTKTKTHPEAVLIRAVEPLHGIEYIQQFRKIKSKKIQNYTNGPGKLCMALNIDKGHDGLDFVESDEMFILHNEESFDIVDSKRINIDYAEEYKDKLWRFYIKDNPFISKK